MGCASPLLQVKTQMQAEAGMLGKDGLYQTGVRSGFPPAYKNGFHGLGVVASSGGMAGLWRGSAVIIGRGAVLSASQLMAYDGIKTTAKKHNLLQDGPTLHIMSSLVAAVVCTTSSMPL